MRKTDAKTLKSCLPQWLREHGLPLHKPFACLNPAHRDAHPSMGYNEKNQTVHCFACGATYDVFDLVGQEENLTDFPSKMKAVNRRYGGGEVIRVTAKPAQAFPYKERAGRPDPYFTGRGLSDEIVQRFGLMVENGYAVLPVFVDGVCRSVCRRGIDPAVEPRYQNSRGAMPLWNSAAMERAAGKALFVTEGIFDALSLEELGFPAVALCGAANTGKLVQKIDEYVPVAWPEKMILAGDSDAAGPGMNGKLREQLTARGIACAVLALPEKYKTCVYLFYYEGYRTAEIAALTGISRQGVWDIIRRAEATLRDIEAKTGLVARFRARREALSGVEARLSGLLSSPDAEARRVAREVMEELRGLDD